VSKGDRGSLTAPRLAPARVTQSSTSSEVEDCEAAFAYFFFGAWSSSRLSLRDFIFDLSSYNAPPSHE
jgi:hypothetical protein